MQPSKDNVNIAVSPTKIMLGVFALLISTVGYFLNNTIGNGVEEITKLTEKTVELEKTVATYGNEISQNSESIDRLEDLLQKNTTRDIELKEEFNAYKIERERAIKDFYQNTLPEKLDDYFEDRFPKK